MHTWLRPHLDNALRGWQGDLRAGRETKKWREEAMRAGRDRADGKFDDYMDEQRADLWSDGIAGLTRTISEDGKATGSQRNDDHN